MSQREAQEHTRRGLILVVEDEDLLREVMVDVLRDEGYRVAEAQNGREALELLRGVRPSLVLLDLQMPVLDGFGFLEEYRAASGPHPPVVVVSATLNQAALRRLAELGTEQVVPKPFEIDDLLAQVGKALDRVWMLERLNAQSGQAPVDLPSSEPIA